MTDKCLILSSTATQELWWQMFTTHDPVHEWTAVLTQH